MAARAVLRSEDDLLLCNECGTQYPVKEDSGKDECKICDVHMLRVLHRYALFLTIIGFLGSTTVRPTDRPGFHNASKVEIGRFQERLVAGQEPS